MKTKNTLLEIMSGWLSLIVLTVATSAYASLTIVSYDVANANLSSFGGWAHTYSGTITPIGGGLADYTGGSGTLNDGSPGTSIGNTQLFDNSGLPTITLHLGGFYTIDSISVFGGDFRDNLIPGLLASMDVSFGGTAYLHSGSPFGFAAVSGPASDQFTISGPLTGVATDKIVLSGFGGPLFLGVLFSIAEIEVEGTSAVVPEPSTYLAGALLALPFGLQGFRWLRNRKQVA